MCGTIRRNECKQVSGSKKTVRSAALRVKHENLVSSKELIKDVLPTLSWDISNVSPSSDGILIDVSWEPLRFDYADSGTAEGTEREIRWLDTS